MHPNQLGIGFVFLSWILFSVEVIQMQLNISVSVCVCAITANIFDRTTFLPFLPVDVAI